MSWNKQYCCRFVFFFFSLLYLSYNHSTARSAYSIGSLSFSVRLARPRDQMFRLYVYNSIHTSYTVYRIDIRYNMTDTGVKMRNDDVIWFVCWHDCIIYSHGLYYSATRWILHDGRELAHWCRRQGIYLRPHYFNKINEYYEYLLLFCNSIIETNVMYTVHFGRDTRKHSICRIQIVILG